MEGGEFPPLYLYFIMLWVLMLLAIVICNPSCRRNKKEPRDAMLFTFIVGP